MSSNKWVGRYCCNFRMPRGVQLSEQERAIILAYNDVSLTGRDIARRLKRSKTVINTFLANPTSYCAVKRSGRRQTLSKRDKRRLFRSASNTLLSASQLKGTLKLQVSVRRVQQLLNSVPYLTYRKLMRIPFLTEAHIQHRLKWAENHVTWGDRWKTVIFSDEKKFNLEGPDGWSFYWHDLRKEQQYFHSPKNNNHSLMVWGGFSSEGTTQLVILDGMQTSASYINTLEAHLLSFAARVHGENFIFQQDNASIHVSHLSRSWFLYKNVKCLDWPARSPDLNPIENLWGIITRKLYQNGRCFQNKEELKSALLHEWQNIDGVILKSLVNSMQGRCISLLKRNGSHIFH